MPGSLRVTAVSGMVSLLLVAGGTTVADGAGAAPPTTDPPLEYVGSNTAGDPLVPGYGNGGYEVDHYDIDVAYDPDSGVLDGTTTVTARTNQPLDRFYLDFALPAASVTVNGQPADFARMRWKKHYAGWELQVTPAHRVPSGSTMSVVVTYSARPIDVVSRGYSEWDNPTTTGVSVWNEPDAASEWWYPCNCYPDDKATYDVHVTVPKDLQALTNGVLLSRTVHGGQATSHWRSTSPMASYLAMLTIGKYDVQTSTGPGGVPLLTAFEQVPGPAMEEARRQVGHLPEILQFLEDQWGPYPFDTGGAVVVETPYDSAFESQTRPTFLDQVFARPGPPLWTVLHETSHQWFGDSVTAKRWRHLWLSEGFATYNEWIWSEHLAQGTAEQLFESNYANYPADDEIWSRPVVHPEQPLAYAIYLRGAMTLQALHNRIGATAFQAVLRGWVADHKDQSVATLAFERYAERVSGVDLDAFFEVWLHQPGKPAPTVENGFPPDAAGRIASGQVVTPASLDTIRRTDLASLRQR